MSFASWTTMARRLSYRPTAIVRPKASPRPMSPSSAARTAPTGWWTGSGRLWRRRPTTVPTTAAPPTSSTSSSSTAAVLRRKKARSTARTLAGAGRGGLQRHAVVGRDLAATDGVGAAVEQRDRVVQVAGDDEAAGRGLADGEVAQRVEVGLGDVAAGPGQHVLHLVERHAAAAGGLAAAGEVVGPVAGGGEQAGAQQAARRVEHRGPQRGALGHQVVVQRLGEAADRGL